MIKDRIKINRNYINTKYYKWKYIVMDWYNKLLRIKYIKEALVDKESKEIFDARIEYMITRDESKYKERIWNIEKEWFCPEVNDKMKYSNSKIILYGCGVDGKENKRILDLCKVPVFAWCDQAKVGQQIEGIEVLSVQECCKLHTDAIIIISSRRFREEMYDGLVKERFPMENVIIPMHGLLVGFNGNQYYDVFSPRKNEIFVDAGAFDGETLLEYAKWAGDNHKKAYCMELQKEMIPIIKNKIKVNNIKNICIQNKAAWYKKEELFFEENGAGSGIRENGKVGVQAIDIDSMVEEDKVTFIKMDIEGAELEALEGAQNTIKKYSPRLAICIYHKFWDVISIADYILSLNPDYRFVIRHYASNMWETVLYGIDKKEK